MLLEWRYRKNKYNFFLHIPCFHNVAICFVQGSGMCDSERAKECHSLPAYLFTLKKTTRIIVHEPVVNILELTSTPKCYNFVGLSQFKDRHPSGK